MIEKVSSK